MLQVRKDSCRRNILILRQVFCERFDLLHPLCKKTCLQGPLIWSVMLYMSLLGCITPCYIWSFHSYVYKTMYVSHCCHCKSTPKPHRRIRNGLRVRGGEAAQSCKPDLRNTVSPLLSASVLRVNSIVIPHEPACNSVTSGWDLYLIDLLHWINVRV